MQDAINSAGLSWLILDDAALCERDEHGDAELPEGKPSVARVVSFC